MPSDHALAAAVLAAAWLAGALSRGPVRRALRDGLRCLGRHPALWRIPAWCALGYAVFQIAAAALFHLRLEEPFPLAAFGPLPSAAALAAAAWLPAAERTAAVFTFFTATFPLSAWCAFRFLLNAGGLLGELARALRQRFGGVRGSLLLLALAAAAGAAILKPAVYLLLPETAAFVPVLVPMAVNALSGAFELLLGVYFLTYLMLMAHAWLRGIHFDDAKLRLFAMRRTGYVLKWSFVILGLAAALIVLPVSVALLAAPEDPVVGPSLWFANGIGRPLVTAIALFSGPVQATLVFHNESLREALREGRRLLARNWTTILPFFVAAYAAFFALETATDAAAWRLGSETLAGLGARVLAAGLEALLAGWLIAAWVCLYKGLSAGRKGLPAGRKEIPF